jgi:hypothetical protein
MSRSPAYELGKRSTGWSAVTSRNTPSPVVTPFFGRIELGSQLGR